MVVKWVAVAAGWFLLVTGVVLFILPVPLGLPVILLALWLLVNYSYGARRMLVRFSRRQNRLARSLEHLRRRRKLARQQLQASDDMA